MFRTWSVGTWLLVTLLYVLVHVMHMALNCRYLLMYHRSILFNYIFFVQKKENNSKNEI